MWVTSLTQKIEDWASKTEIVYKIAERYYHEVIRREVVLADITKDDHILCIGGGICPFSAILLNQASGAKVTVIDNNISCISKAKKLIKRMGLSKEIKVIYQDGGSLGFPFSEYTVIHFALQVCPMEHVFSNIERQAAVGTKLLLRRPKRKCKQIYSRLANNLLCDCPLTEHKNACNIGSTLLYIKQEGSYEDNALVAGDSYTPSSCPYPVAI